MNNRFISGLILSGSIISLVSCTTVSWEETDDGVIVSPGRRGSGSPRLVKVEVVTPEILRVRATPATEFPDRTSLIVLPRESSEVPFTVSWTGQSVLLSTEKVTADISLKTGRILFTDPEGKEILREMESGGKSFTPITVEGTSGYSFRQVFESPEDEAFYGLGQHQSDEWNYKGRNELLYQYNTKVSVPFVISSRNYGILWDNYSLSKFGDVRDYSDLSKLRLYDLSGEEGGLTATYITAEGETFVRRKESAIDYENLTTIRNFPEEFPFGQSNITWEGELEADESGEYEFKLYYAGYTRVFLAGDEVVAERWRTAWNPNTYKFRVNLEAGKRVPLRVEWKPDGGVSYLGLKVLGPLDPAEQGRLSLWSEMGRELDYYFISGETMDGVIGGYRNLTGKAPIMPQWAYGFWQSRERYRTQDEIVATLAEFRRRGIPIDNMVQDWFYWEEDRWGSHEFDPVRFPDPQKMVDDIHSMNAHVMISVWPKFYVNTGHFREFDRNGWMYRQAVEDSVRDWVGPGYTGSFYDAYSEGARILFWEQMHEHLYSLGFDAWWMDASEPDILSNASLEYRKQLCGPTAMGPSTEFFNTYALMNADAIYKGQRKVDPGKRVFLLTRSGFSGLQRYSTATWSGDIGTRWEDMKAQITAGMNFALSGIPYWTMDIGGFCVENRYVNAEEGSGDLDEWRELNARWYQFGTFLPIFRAHGQYPYREVFHIAPEGHPAYRSIVFYNRLRYRLMPYIYSLAEKVWSEDYTLMRALVMDFTDDETARGVDDQFMLGPSLMVCPVVEHRARERDVYFPGGTGWYDLYTGRYLDGGVRRSEEAPYERIPLYVKEGSILPYGPDIQFVGEKPGAPVTFYVYGGADASFTLYEDDGTSYNYEQGSFSRIMIKYEEASGSVVIGQQEGDYEGIPAERIFHFVKVDRDEPQPFGKMTIPGVTVNFTGEETTIQLK